MERLLDMTDDAIRTKHREGVSISILAELNACSANTIKAIVNPDKEIKPVAEIKPVSAELPKMTTREREAKQLELYNQGKPDSQIGDMLGVHPQAVFLWRKKNGLPSQSKRKGVMVPPVVPKPAKELPISKLTKEEKLEALERLKNVVTIETVKPANFSMVDGFTETMKIKVFKDPEVPEPKESPVQFTHFEPIFMQRASDDPGVPCQKHQDEEALAIGIDCESEIVSMAAPLAKTATEFWAAINKPKPPIGLMPRKMWEIQRLTDLAAAIKIRMNLWHTIPIEWLEEYNERAKYGCE